MKKLADTVKQFLSNRKMNSLWNEYKKVAKLGDTVLKNKKLNSFLAQFKQVALDYLEKQKTNPKLEKLFTEIADLLSILIDQVSHFDEKTVTTKEPDIRGYFKNVLQSLELIVKDPAYREQLQSSTVLLTQLVSMLNNLDDEEAKLILIKLLGILGGSLENKVIIGRDGGFRKLVGLMLEQNEDLVKGIIDAFKQILDITPEKDDLALTKPTSTLDVASLSPAEIRSLFDPLQDECSPGGRPAKSMVALPKPESRPSFDALQRMSIELKTVEPELTLGRASETRDKSEAADKKNRMTCLTLFKHYEESKHPFEDTKGDAVAEEMVIQGVLDSLKEILLTTRRDLQIDLMQIIAKLLVKSTYNQQEFQKIEGYFVLAVMLNQKRDCTDVNERRYLRTCMQTLKRIVYNDDDQKVIKNTEAFKVLLSLISTSQQLLTVSEALILLNEILGANVRNCLIFLKMLGFVDLHVLILRLLFPEDSYETLLHSEFCSRNHISKFSGLCNYHYVRHEETVTSQTFGEGTKKITECFELEDISEKDRVELFTVVDQVLMSLSFILTPLHIMPCAQVYADVLGNTGLKPPFQKCLLDRLEMMIVEKLAKVNVKDYENPYCPDLEQTLGSLAVALRGMLEQTPVPTELFTNALDIFHKYLLFAGELEYGGKAGIIGPEGGRNHLGGVFVKAGDLLDKIYAQAEEKFVNNPYYTELLYSVVELLIYVSLPCEPVVKFVARLIQRGEKWKYQDLLLLESACSSPSVAEAVVASNPVLLFSPASTKLTSIFATYILCKGSAKNRALLDSLLAPLEFPKVLDWNNLSESQQVFVGTVLRELVNGTRYEDLDYNVLLPEMDPKDMELIDNIRSEMKTGFHPRSQLVVRPRNFQTGLRNCLIVILADSAPAAQSKLISEVVRDLTESPQVGQEWMHYEVIDAVMEIYASLEDTTSPVKVSYLKLITALLAQGVSLTRPEVLHRLMRTSAEFRHSVLEILESSAPPISLVVMDHKPESDMGIYTVPLKYFPRERVGFSVDFWVKFPLVAGTLPLVELVEGGKEGKAVFSGKYQVAPVNVAPKKEEEAGGSARGSSRGEVLKHYLVTETEGILVKVELEVPLLESDKWAHVAMHYSKNAHSWYVNGKQVYCSKAGTQHAYPMAFVKGLRLKISPQPKSLSPVTLYEGAIDPKLAFNLWLKGPIDGYYCTSKELGIDLPRLYKFPKPTKDKSLEAPFEKLVFEKGTSVPKLVSAQAQYVSRLKFPPDAEYQTPNTKNVKPTDLYETSGVVLASHCVTLKEFLSSPEFVQLALRNMQNCSAAEFSSWTRILTLLFIRNDRFVSLLPKEVKLSGILISLAVSRKAVSTDSSSDLNAILGSLFDLLCAQQNSFGGLNVFTKPNLLLVPVLHPSRFEYFKALQSFMILAGQLQREALLNVLSNLLIRQENAEKLAAEGLQTMLVYLLKEACEKRSDSDSFMYEKLLEVFQLFFHWHHILDWELLFSFFLMLKSGGKPGAQDVLADVLSILSVYMFVSSNKTALAEKFISVGGLKILYALVDSPNIPVVEHSIKLLATLMLANPKLKSTIAKSKGFDILTHRLSTKTPTFSFLQTLLDFVVGTFKVQTLYPQTNSYVSTVINRSPIASEVLNQVPAATVLGLANPEILEALFAGLSRTKEFHYRINMLRQLEPAIVTEHDAQKAIDVGVFVWIVEYFKSLEAEQQKVTKEVAAESLKKIQKMTLKIICGIITKELEKPAAKCGLVKLLQKIPSVDHIQLLAVERLLKTLCKDNSLKKEPANVIRNLGSLFEKLDTILTLTDDLKFKLVRVINVLASKNTTEIRTLMKDSRLFDYRDSFLIDLLNSEIQTIDSLQLLQQINLEALAGSEKFRSGKTIESILSWALESKDPALRQGFFDIFQKQVCKSAENLKYLSKVLDDPVLVGIIQSKTLDEVDRHLEKTKGKGASTVLKTAAGKKTEKRNDKAKSANERSQRRTKVFAEVGKEKSGMQENIVEYEKQEAKYVAVVGPQLVEKRVEELRGGLLNTEGAISSAT